MRLLLFAVLSTFSPAAGAAEVTVKTKTPAAAVAALVRYTAPKGWTASDYSNSGGADPVVRLENLADAITVKAYGAPGSAYATPEAFLVGPAATSQGGSAPTPDTIAEHPDATTARIASDVTESARIRTALRLPARRPRVRDAGSPTTARTCARGG